MVTGPHHSHEPARGSEESTQPVTDFDDTGRVLRQARRLRAASVIAAMMLVAIFGFLLDPLLEQRIGTRATRLLEAFAVGAVLVIVTSPLSRMLKRSIVELHDIREQWRFEAIRDSLTGLFNRRHFDDRLEEEVARRQRHGNPLSLILTDLDHFKNINDRHGHQAGDAALRELARRIRRMFRREDVVARIGGDELAILLPDTSIAESLVKARRLKDSVAAEPVSVPVTDIELPMTVSCGVASANELVDSADDLVRKADEALYEAKKTRNAVAVVRDDEPARMTR